MRLPSPFARLTHRAAAAVATEVAEVVRSTAEATLAEVVEAVRAEVAAPIAKQSSYRGRTVATVAVVTATAVVATAAYVWWKRRDHLEPATIAEVEYPNETPAAPRPAPVAAAAPVVASTPVVEVAHAYAEPVAPAPVVEPIVSTPATTAPVAEAKPMAIDNCSTQHDGPRPSVAAANPSIVRPPATTGRFVLPTASRVLP
ncbi:MAG: hypothetical protein DWI48_07210 [Chloroflexi bacterium]|nr:MAG: hypothetical protein DWI48_07210 [Chloroflexota bacterium]